MRRVITIIGLLLGFIFLTGFLFMTFSSQFGAKPSAEDRLRYQQSPTFNGRIFENQIATNMGMQKGSTWSTLWQYLKGNPNRTPKKGDVQVIPVTPEALSNTAQDTRILWFGHSTFLLQHGGKNYLFDPVFADVPSPVSWLGTPRYSGELPIKPELLPDIDAVFISHDHYDHLDMDAIQLLNDKVAHFYVPLGVGNHLRKWGVEASRISEMDWWQEQPLHDFKLVLTPARHFSGRRLTGQNQTLWGAWLLKSDDFSLYFSGDSGYGPHFKEVFERYGAVDFALIECGQYNVNWADIHMLPEQSVQAARDLQARVMMPVHWGAFTLSLHDWFEPAVRATAAAEQAGQPIVIPQIGELMLVNNEPIPRNAWWENVLAELRSNF